jgi:hypothetical protein
MGGYANRVITIHFEELSEPDDDVYVVIRNPKTVALSKLNTDAVVTNPDGTVNEAAAAAAGYATLAQLIIGGRLYDATVDGIDETGNPVTQPLLTYPLTADQAKRLPVQIINQVFTHIREAQTPP